MSEQIYGFMPPGRFNNPQFNWEEITDLKTQKANGIFLIAPNITDKHVELGNRCDKLGLDLILGFTDEPAKPNLERLEKTMQITNRIAIGNTHLHEWRDNEGRIPDYLRMADDYGFEWVCTLTQNSVLRDIKRGNRLRRQLGSTLCLCLCGYSVAGILYGNEAIPEQHVVKKELLGAESDYELMIKKLQNYLAPMNILSGGGYQAGLDAGSRVYVQRLNFKGMVIGMPFKLEGTDKIPANI